MNAACPQGRTRLDWRSQQSGFLGAMKKSFGLGLFFAAMAPLVAAVAIGDSFEQVVAEKGAPAGKMQAGATQVLRYADQTIKLKEGRVVAIEAVISRAPPVPAPAPKAVAKPTPAPVPLVWSTDFTAALGQAQDQDRRVFVFFTGSDWCGWCKRLQKEILSTPEFARYAREKLILVELDFPKQKPQAPETKTQNENLARRFRISGFPTVIVLDRAGKAIGRLGYQEGGPEPFLGKIDQL
jgi:protein disulfide-isomerase